MLLVLIGAGIVLLLFALFKFSKNNRWGERPYGYLAAGWFIGGILLLLCLIITPKSYMSYIQARSFYDATNTQYKESISMYADRAVLKVSEDTFTDLKYQGYQENIAKLITDLRSKVVWYNDVIIQKRILNKSIAFDWLIITPDDDMKIITMLEQN